MTARKALCASIQTPPFERRFPNWRAVLAPLLLLPALCVAHAPSSQECSEGADFIRNAALARDHGMSEHQFMQRIHDDLELIKSFPPELRWFVQDEEDAQLLVSAASAVFQQPKEAAAHHADFLRTCIARADDDTPITSPRNAI
ncbi:hypothetical protein [Noviherbaspirillum saxi]|nr:hypothetical protein [Noviherbaspirillum saxi]